MNSPHRRPRILARLTVGGVLACVLLSVAAPRNSSTENRVVLSPRLQAGQSLKYQIYARLQRVVSTQSRVTSMMKPPDLKEDISLGFQITIKEIRLVNGRLVVVVHGEFVFPKDAAGMNDPSSKPMVDFTIDHAGQVQKVEGLDNLDTEQRLVWQFWVARFAYGWTLPPEGVRPGQTWKTEEAERIPGPIANLVWEQGTTYGQNDKCVIVPAEKCAVFLTTAKLKQKSTPTDTTPEEYKLHELKTSGTTKGTNEIFTSISLKSGLVLRATEDGKQSMDVEIAKKDGTNGIHYTVDVTSRFEMVLVPDGQASRR
jgi:hypothetical protein